MQACRWFDNAGQCVSFCPPPFIYSATEHQVVPNPAVKYAYGTLCVDQCPREYAPLASLSLDCAYLKKQLRPILLHCTVLVVLKRLREN